MDNQMEGKHISNYRIFRHCKLCTTQYTQHRGTNTKMHHVGKCITLMPILSACVRVRERACFCMHLCMWVHVHMCLVGVQGVVPCMIACMRGACMLACGYEGVVARMHVVDVCPSHVACTCSYVEALAKPTMIFICKKSILSSTQQSKLPIVNTHAIRDGPSQLVTVQGEVCQPSQNRDL